MALQACSREIAQSRDQIQKRDGLNLLSMRPPAGRRCGIARQAALLIAVGQATKGLGPRWSSLRCAATSGGKD